MSARRARRLAFGLLALVVAATTAGLVLVGLGYRYVDEATTGNSSDVWVSLVTVPMAVLWGVVGALVASRRPQNPIGWLFLAAALGIGLALPANAYAAYSVYGEHDLPLAAWAAWTNTWLFAISGIVAPFVVFLLFPSGRFLSPRWRWVTVVLVLAAFATFVADGLAPGTLDGHPELVNPIGIDSAVRDAVSTFGAVALGPVAMLVGIASLLVRFRRARGDERTQITWVVVTGMVACAGFLAAFTFAGKAGWMVGLGGIVAIPVAAGVAILRYRLYAIDRLVDRTIVYLPVTAALAGMYFAIVLGLQQALSGFTEGSDLAIAASTLAVAALFRPLRRRVQALVDRRFYRRRYDASLALASFAARVRDQVDLDELAAGIGTAVHETVRPSHVSLWLRPAPDTVTISGRPSPTTGTR